MTVDQKKAGVVLSYLSQAIVIITGIVYTPVMLRLLGKSEYGLYQMVYSVVSYLGLLNLGFGSSYMRFYSRFKAEDDDDAIAGLNGMFMIVFTIMSVVCLVSGLIMSGNARAILGNKLTEGEIGKAGVLMALMVVNLALTFPDSVFNCTITANEKFLFQKLLLVIKNAASPLIALPLLIMGYGSVGMVAVTTFITMAGFIADIVFCNRKLYIRFDFRHPDMQLLKSIWGFTFFIFLNQIIDQINWSIDRVVLGRVRGTAATAVYGIGAQINTLYIQLSSSVSGVFIPQVNRIVADSDDNTRLSDLFIKVGRVQYLVLSLAMTGMIFFGRPFISVWAGNGYDESYGVMLLLVIPATVPLIQNIGIEIQRARNKHQVRSVVYFFVAIVNVAISIPLAVKYGPIGAALGTTITMIIGNALFMNWYYEHGIGLDVRRFWHSIFSMSRGLVIPCIAGTLMLIISGFGKSGKLLGLIPVYCVIFAVSMWKFGINEEEKTIITNILKKFKRV